MIGITRGKNVRQTGTASIINQTLLVGDPFLVTLFGSGHSGRAPIGHRLPPNVYCIHLFEF
jgi:hypothetical protein